MAQEKLSYDFSVCRDLFENARKNDETGEAVKYYHDRVFHTENGGVYVYKKGDLTYCNYEEFKKNQMIGFPKKLRDAIDSKVVPFEEVLEQATWTIDKEKRMINSLKAVHAEKLKKVVVGKKGKAYVEFFKTYVKEILANKREDLYDYIIKWLSNVVKLRKNKTALIIVSATEGIGKTSIAKVMEKLLGVNLVCYPNLKNLAKFNFQLFGKVLVVLEETQGLKQDAEIFDAFKNLTNNDIFSYRQMYVQPKDLPNINNIIATSNYCLGIAGRRYINITPSTKWLNKDDLFDQLYDLDDENTKALYDFLLSVDTEKFNEEKEGKKLCCSDGNLKEIERMNNVFAFMKDNYALEKQNEKIKPVDLFGKYKASGIQKPFSKSGFYEKISELNVPKAIMNGYEYYKIDGTELYEEFKKRNLIHKDDLEGREIKEEIKTNAGANPVEKENESLKQQLAEMQKQMEALLQKNAESKTEKVSQPTESRKIISVKAFKPKV